MTGLLWLGVVIVCWLMIVGAIAIVGWQSHRASIRSEESESERQARIRKLLDMQTEGEHDPDGYWRTD